LVSTLFFLAAIPFAKLQLPQIWPFIPAYQAALATSDLVTAVLLFAQFSIVRRYGLLALACGYLFTAAMAVIHALSFPGLFAPTGLLGAGPQTTAWLYMFWHAGFPLAVLYHAWAKDRPDRRLAPEKRVRGPVAAGVVATLGAAVALTLVATAGQNALPPIMRGNNYTPAMLSVVSSVWLASAAAFVALWLRRPHSVLDLWLMVVMSAWVFDVALSAVLNQGRFDLGFYAGRVYGLLAATFVLVVLLSEANVLYTQLAKALAAKLGAAQLINQRIFETSVDLILVADSYGTIVQVSPSALAILGYRPEEMAGRSAREFLHPPDLDATREEMRQARHTGGTRRFSCRYDHKNGGAVRLSWAGLWSESDHQYFFIGRDMTDQDKAETALREAKDMFAAIIDASPEAILCLDPKRNVLIWNRAAEQIFGYSAEETLNQPYKLVPTGGEDEYRDLVDRAMRGERLSDIRVKRRRKDGALRQIAFSCAPLFDAAGGVRAVIYVLQDITERQTIEQQLRQSQKLEAVGQLTGGLAHDFNNLLGVIIGNLDLALETADAKDQNATFMKSALEAGMRGAELVRRLMLFSRRQPLNPTVFPVNQAIEEFTPLLRRALGEAVELQTQFDAAAGRVAADKHQLENALMNLCVNARDAMPSGGAIRIETSNVIVDADSAAMYPGIALGRYTAVSVTDNGVGIAPENLQKVFEPFFTTKPEGKGTGLGLSMVYGFMRESGGTVKIYSELGHGTTIRLYFPKTEAEADADVSAAAAADAVLPRGSELVLVVEDRVDMRAVAVAALERLGYRVLEAENVASALAVLNSGAKIDLVFSDIVMPGGQTGLDLAKEIRQRGEKPPVLLTSGYASPQTLREQAQKLGLPLIGKPYRVADLAARVRAVLDGRNGNGRNGAQGK
jgi:PAS domain S-box-containing protein